MHDRNGTPGTWYAIGANIRALDGEQIAIVQGRQTVGAGPAVWAKQAANERRDAANARLIAAAPALLEAVDAAWNYLTEKDDADAHGSLRASYDGAYLLQLLSEAGAAARGHARSSP